MLKYLLCLLMVISAPAFSVEPDWSAYAALLKRHVSVGKKNGTNLNLVNYPALKNDALLAKALRQLAVFPASRLASREERIAFYLNAYNLFAIKMVVDHWPTKSIKDIGGLFSPVWTMPVGDIGGEPATLDHIEHKVLRRMSEPRIHVGLTCASVSCPDLRDEPYTAAHVYEQLDDQMRRFLNNPAKGLSVEGGSIHVSHIFSWYFDDFKVQGGYDNLIRRYKPTLPVDAAMEPNLPYDWSVNGPP